jgi:hypothetical protein
LIAIAVAGGSVLWTFSNPASDFSLFALPVAACIAALLMPSTHFLAGYALVFVLGGAVRYGEHLLPSHSDSLGHAIVDGFVGLSALGMVVGAVLNIVFRLCWRKWGTGSPPG